MTSGTWTAAMAVLLSALAPTLRGQQPAESLDSGVAAPVNRDQIEAALKLTTSAADRYEIRLRAQETPAKRLADPVLKWSNPSVGEIHGNVFLWTVNDRPAAIGSLFKWFSPHTHMSHEFHALAETPLVGKYDGAEVWRTQAGGIKFQTIPAAPPPAATVQQRLLQIRRLARDFTASKRDRDGVAQELRLLTQPLYRYAAADAGIVDGALFVLVQGTDPEVFLLIEARGEKGSPAYCFAAARMNSVEFQLRYQDREVWATAIMPWREIASHAEIYTSFRHEQVALPE